MNTPDEGSVTLPAATLRRCREMGDALERARADTTSKQRGLDALLHSAATTLYDVAAAHSSPDPEGATATEHVPDTDTAQEAHR